LSAIPTGGMSSWRRAGPGASQTDTCAGWNALSVTPSRSWRTVSRSTVFRGRAVNAATRASASYRDRLNRRSTIRCTRRRTGLNGAAMTSVATATATEPLIEEEYEPSDGIARAAGGRQRPHCGRGHHGDRGDQRVDHRPAGPSLVGEAVQRHGRHVHSEREEAKRDRSDRSRAFQTEGRHVVSPAARTRRGQL